jgi:hypothetical protein
MPRGRSYEYGWHPDKPGAPGEPAWADASPDHSEYLPPRKRSLKRYQLASARKLHKGRWRAKARKALGAGTHRTDPTLVVKIWSDRVHADLSDADRRACEKDKSMRSLCCLQPEHLEASLRDLLASSDDPSIATWAEFVRDQTRRRRH